MIRKSQLFTLSLIVLITILFGIVIISTVEVNALSGIKGEKFEQPDGTYRCMGDGEKCDI